MFRSVCLYFKRQVQAPKCPPKDLAQGTSMRQSANFDILSHIANKIDELSDHLLLRSMTNLYRRRGSESSGFSVANR